MPKEDLVISWMLGEGRQTDHDMAGFGERLCSHIVKAGIPISRTFCGVHTLHPLVGAVGYIWHRATGKVEQYSATWDHKQSDEFLHNPATRAVETGRSYRQRLDGAEVPDYDLLQELRAQGLTDYLALPMTFSDGIRNPLSFQTDAPGGFSDADIKALEQIARVVSLVVEAETRDRIARQVLETYVGRRTGEQILKGGIRRGYAETIDAVVWFSDLRGFTALTETTSRDELLQQLDAHFETLVSAIEGAGGEVLKFLGDGLLAIFEVDKSSPPDRACRAAMDAMAAAQSSPEGPNLSWALALDLGEVSYGNIGGATRLDFTVIGPSVNHAARLEALTGELDEPVLISEAFADALGTPLRDLGEHRLKGVAVPQRVFAPVA